MDKHTVQNVKKLLRKRPFFALTLLIYNSLPLIGISQYSWNIEYMVVLFWIEAIILSFVIVVQNGVFGPVIRGRYTAANYAFASIAMAVLFQPAIVWLAYEQFSSIIGQSLLTFLPGLSGAIITMLYNYGSTLRHRLKNRSSYKPTNSFVYRWAIQAFLPLQVSMIALQIDAQAHAWIFFLLGVVKVAYALWLELPVRKRKMTEGFLRPHPFSVYYFTQLFIAPAAMALFLFGSNAQSWSDGYWSAGTVFALAGLCFVWTVWPPRSVMWIEAGQLHLVTGRLLRRRRSWNIQEIQKFVYKGVDAQQLSFPGWYMIVEKSSRSILLSRIDFSLIELHDYLKDIVYTYPTIKANFPQRPSEHAKSGLR
jgi:hypothetical protein